MNQLITIRANELFSKQGEEFKKVHELVFVVDQPEYKYSNEREVIRERKLETFKFIVADENLDQVIELLQELKKKP